MVFPSVPIYLDPPNWNQQQGHQQGINTSSDVHLPLGASIAPPRPEPGLPGSSSNPGSQNRPNSMAERARMARLPQPEQALKCPRCESSNTKFCYYNNYSLSQPRHFCKTCRRYWTRGGALRNVPVGGGCRRNKRSKSNSASAKSSSSSVTSTTSSASASATASASAIPSNRLPFLGTMNPLLDYGASNLGLGFGMGQQTETMDYPVVSGAPSMMSHFPQFPFFGGFEGNQQSMPPVPAMYRLGLDGNSGMTEGAFSRHQLVSQMASVKMEEHRQYMNAARGENVWNNNRNTIGGSSGGDGTVTGTGTGAGTNTGGWISDLPGFNSQSTGNLS
ncbi:hypothetical protein LUZ60_012965 [Juncus effusus]|nr:hypothetical protein LUZ60_012965 [Juncus effusus]